MSGRVFASALAFAALGAAQHVAQDPAFEAVTIKPADPSALGYTIRGGPANRGGKPDPGRIEYVHLSLQQLLLNAYGLLPFELSGPSWLDATRFDVTAKLTPGTTQEQLPLMLRQALIERFHVAAHREIRQQTLYKLTVAKGGPKLKASTAPEASLETDGPLKGDSGGFPAPVAGRVMRLSLAGRIRVSAGRQSSAEIAKMLSGFLAARVTDETGLNGRYDFTLEFAEDSPAAEARAGRPDVDPAPGLSTGVQEQLGLHLEKSKGPVEILVIESVDRSPGEN